MANQKSFETKFISVGERHHNWRLDRFLAEQEFVSSRSRAAWLIENGLVTLANKTLKASLKVHTGQTLCVMLPLEPSSKLRPFEIPLDILFEDDDCAVINKPAGMVVHPAAGHAQDTLVNALLHNIKNLSMGFNEQRPGIVHRLDRDTSGILVVAKNDFAHERLAAQFKKKSVHRIYWALVYGTPKPAQGTIRSYLARHPTQRKRFSSQNSGKMAVTHFSTIQNSPRGVSWLKCQLETGRTHQIRVHMSEAKHPILADPIYASDRWNKALSRDLQEILGNMKRIGLHARELGFLHPRSGQPMQFSADWPEDLKAVVKLLGFHNV